PENPQALDAHASALIRAGRPEEAHRAASRALQVGPRMVTAHCERIRALRDAERPGAAFHGARASWNLVGELWNQGQLPAAGGPHPRWAHPLPASAHVDVGRLDEGAAIARRALDRAPSSGPGFRARRAELERWETDPAVLAAAYARDGHFRRE